MYIVDGWRKVTIDDRIPVDMFGRPLLVRRMPEVDSASVNSASGSTGHVICWARAKRKEARGAAHGC